MNKLKLVLVMAVLSASTVSLAQGGGVVSVGDSSGITMDGIRFHATDYAIDSATRAATVTITLTSLSERSRELKLNVYGTQLVDDQRNAYYFSTLTMGRVLMRFEDRQNYLHYLLQPHTPVEMIITAQDVAPDASGIQVVKLVFEDRKDKGRFLEVYLAAPATQ